ncbi:sec1 family domain-containing protein, putative [Eimeria necatrix]|uniref:Sec1 family domain-containing protein, putative n=1 Tax=Eimeria necatrix TaxID=51315 RepID=U6MLJ2_9EIME|nr:sec1 family domain-containing protein, putative [Eimeria necatrix]CDJ63334.1 sec1 family domain-containing protein, putative [Eimeria necatrix]
MPSELSASAHSSQPNETPQLSPPSGSSGVPTPAAAKGASTDETSDVVRETCAAVSAYYRRMFLDALSTVEGHKLLVLEDSLASPVSHIVDASSLQQHGVDRCFALKAVPICLASVPQQTAVAPTVLFFCRPRLSRLPLIIQHINYIESSFPQAQASLKAAGGLQGVATRAPQGVSQPTSSDAVLWRYPLPPASSQSGRKYVVVLVSEPSDYIASELRRLLSACTPAAPAAATGAANGASSLPAAAAALISNLGNSLLPLGATNSAAAGNPFSSSSGSSSVSPDCVVVTHCPLRLFPVDRDVLSLEIPNFFRAYHGQGDVSLCRSVAAAIDVLQEQQQQQLIPNLRCIGSAAKAVSDFLILKRKQQQQKQRLQDPCLNLIAGPKEPVALQVPPVYSVLDAEDCGVSPSGVSAGCSLAPGAEVGDAASASGCTGQAALALPHLLHMLVLFDRRVDLVSPLCTDFTYQGLLDSILGVDGTGVEVPKHILQQQQQQQQQQPQQQLCEPLPGSGSSSSSPGPGSSILIERGRGQRVSLAGDSLFMSLRDCHQSLVGSKLHKIASEIKETYIQKDGLRTIEDISCFMTKFKRKQQEHASLSLHVKLASFVSAVFKDPNFHNRLCLEDKLLQGSGGGGPAALLPGQQRSNNLGEAFDRLIDESAATEAAAASGCCSAAATTLDEVYRLLCLASVTGGGLKPTQLKPLLHGLVQQHGVRELRRIAYLQRVGLLREQNSQKKAKGAAAAVGPEAWRFVRDKCQLMLEENEAMQGIAYVCSGYSPLSVRLLQLLHETPLGWRAIPDVLNSMWGPALEIRQQQPQPPALQQLQSPVTQQKQQLQGEGSNTPSAPPLLVLVLYIGGVSHAEIAAIRRLNELERDGKVKADRRPPNTRIQYLILTTEIINTRQLFHSMIDDVD